MDAKKLDVLNKQVRVELGLLGFQFVLGMVMNLFAVPPDDPKYVAEPLWLKGVFPTHAIVGTLLLIGAIMIAVFSAKSKSKEHKKLGMYGLISILIAFAGGILTVTVKGDASELGSLVMAIGFLLSFISYGKYLFVLKK